MWGTLGTLARRLGTAGTAAGFTARARLRGPQLVGAAVLAGGLAGGLADAEPAAGADFEVTGDVAAQAYDVPSPWGDQIVARRRLYSTVGLAAYNLQGEYRPFEPSYSVQLRMRIDADFGVDGAEEGYSRDDPLRGPGRFVPGLDHSPVDLMYGYVEGRHLLKGLLGFRVGRQYVTDVLGWWSFDGGLLRVVTPFFVQAELYGGLEQRGGLPLSTSRFEAQGVWRGSHEGFRDNAQDYPSYQFVGQAPAFGVALETNGPNWIHGRFDYRRVYNLAAAFTSQFPAAGGGYEKIKGSRLSQERFGYALSAFLADLGALRGGFVYDVYAQLLSRAYGGIEAHVGRRVTLGADVDYYIPTFDADSIFNWFSHAGSLGALGRVAAQPSDRLELTVSGGVKLWMTEGDPDSWAFDQCSANVDATLPPAQRDAAIAACMSIGTEPSAGADRGFSRGEEARATELAPDALGNLGARYRWGTGHAAAHAMMEIGVGSEAENRGRRVGGGLSGKQKIVGDMLWLGARASVYDWHDPLRPDRDATSFGYVLAPEIVPAPFVDVRLEWEHDMNRLVGQRFRVLGLVRMQVDTALFGGASASRGGAR